LASNRKRAKSTVAEDLTGKSISHADAVHSVLSINSICSVVDVQRMSDAALDLGCRLGP
jgi:hypothetical protein